MAAVLLALSAATGGGPRGGFSGGDHPLAASAGRQQELEGPGSSDDRQQNRSSVQVATIDSFQVLLTLSVYTMGCCGSG